jgi:hypothetical protein
VLLQDGFDTSPDGTSEWRAAAEAVDWLVWRAKGEDAG